MDKAYFALFKSNIILFKDITGDLITATTKSELAIRTKSTLREEHIELVASMMHSETGNIRIYAYELNTSDLMPIENEKIVIISQGNYNQHHSKISFRNRLLINKLYERKRVPVQPIFSFNELKIR